MIPGKRNLITDVTGILVGNAQDQRLKSGATVLTAASPFVAGVHVMGGAPGTRETDLLAPDKSVAKVDALALAGGSAFGLDACSGVVDGLRAQGRGFAVFDATVPLVPGAILFDLLNGGDKDWQDNPYRKLGRSAFESAAPEFQIGSVGAGAGALTAMLKGGLGSASFVLDGGITVGALVAVNPMGRVTTPGERHFWAAPFEMNGEFGALGPDPSTGLGRALQSRKAENMRARSGANAADRANTTIAIVATDAVLTKAQCQRIATAAHDGIARAIVPSHTPADGDLVFSMTTSAKNVTDIERQLPIIGHAASLCLARAIARAIYHARPAPGDTLPCWAGGAI